MVGGRSATLHFGRYTALYIDSLPKPSYYTVFIHYLKRFLSAGWPPCTLAGGRSATLHFGRRQVGLLALWSEAGRPPCTLIGGRSATFHFGRRQVGHLALWPEAGQPTPCTTQEEGIKLLIVTKVEWKYRYTALYIDSLPKPSYYTVFIHDLLK